MSLKIPEGLLHATRLVRRGKLSEATDAIQRALRGGYAPSAYKPDAGMDVESEPIPGYYRVVELEPQESTGKTFVGGTYANAAGTRRYKIYIPASHGRGALPLVVMLHGCRQDPDDFAAGTRMNLLAEELGFIVVYPGQPGDANAHSCWNWFEPGHQQRDVGEPSLIAGITREVVKAHGVDADRVYIAGLSAGGAMAAVMGATYPDVYAAVGVHSGLAYGSARDVATAFSAMRGPGPLGGRRKAHGAAATAQNVPMIVFHGDSDTTVHPSNGDDLIAQASPAPEAAAGPEGAREARVERGTARGREYTRTTYTDDSGRPVMEQWLVHGANHAWSGGSAEGSFADTSGPDASREMLRFFLQHRKS
ncbi:MAG TPA: PHB depolymerase family esterase [Burkholderiales bacterium]|nr:PHB depolymerase family esterase [Burkholderiales bacterium]